MNGAIIGTIVSGVMTIFIIYSFHYDEKCDANGKRPMLIRIQGEPICVNKENALFHLCRDRGHTLDTCAGVAFEEVKGQTLSK